MKSERRKIMGDLKDFKISFSGLSLGHHQYDLVVNDSFFECFEYSEIKKGDIAIKLDLEKSERFIILNFEYKGSLQAPCDRCLDDLTVDIDEQNRLIVKFGENDEEDFSDEIIILSAKEHEVDVSKFVYDSIILSIPFQKTHDDIRDCDQEMISRMEELATEEESADPRWNALKKIKLEE